MHMPYLLLYVPYFFLVLALTSTIFLSKYFAQLLFSKWQEENDAKINIPSNKVPELENLYQLKTHKHFSLSPWIPQTSIQRKTIWLVLIKCNWRIKQL